MLARRVTRVLSLSSQTVSRPFTTFPAIRQAHKTPALSNITENDAATFEAKQRAFRERLIAEQEAQRRKEEAEKEARVRDMEGGKKKGALSSLIYGTPEGRELDKDMERSFSQVLARGKYVHSIVFHEVKPDKVDEYVELVGSWYPKMASMPENKVNLVGSWRTEVGDCDTFGRLFLLSML